VWYYLFLVLLTVTGCQSLPDNGVTFFQSPNTEEAMSQRSVSFYNSLSAAQSEGATDTGRIPAWVPASATNLNESHSVDTVQSLLAFTFNPADLATMTATCEPLTDYDIQYPALQAEWWSPDLRDMAGASGHGYKIYDCFNEMGYLAIDEAANQAYFWIP
jgi:hypothetical protein